MRKLLHHIWHLPRKLIALLITGYQHTLSPDHGPLRHLYDYGYCRHDPSCSQYAKQVIIKQGVTIGIPKVIWRVLTCNPFAKMSDEKLRKVVAKASQ